MPPRRSQPALQLYDRWIYYEMNRYVSFAHRLGGCSHLRLCPHTTLVVAEGRV